MALSDGEKILKICLFVLAEFTNVTDGQRDRQTPHDGIGRACVASRDKNDKTTAARRIKPRSSLCAARRYRHANLTARSSMVESLPVCRDSLVTAVFCNVANIVSK